MNNDIRFGYSSPRWTGEIADCSLPVTFDTYSNCAFGCVYCFSQYQRGIGGAAEDYYAKKVKAVDPEKVKNCSGENCRTLLSGPISKRGGRFSMGAFQTSLMDLKRNTA